MRMTRYMIAVAILCLTNFVYCQPQQACLDASQALNNNIDCFTAFSSIATAGSNSPACSGTCGSLIEDVLENCADIPVCKH